MRNIFFLLLILTPLSFCLGQNGSYFGASVLHKSSGDPDLNPVYQYREIHRTSPTMVYDTISKVHYQFNGNYESVGSQWDPLFTERCPLELDIIYVSKAYGDNNTAEKGYRCKPFQNPWEAVGVASKGDQVIVLDGVWAYTDTLIPSLDTPDLIELGIPKVDTVFTASDAGADIFSRQANLFKDGITIDFAEGTKIVNLCKLNKRLCLFETVEDSMRIKITGSLYYGIWHCWARAIDDHGISGAEFQNFLALRHSYVDFDFTGDALDSRTVTDFAVHVFGSGNRVVMNTDLLRLEGGLVYNIFTDTGASTSFNSVVIKSSTFESHTTDYTITKGFGADRLSSLYSIGSDKNNSLLSNNNFDIKIGQMLGQRAAIGGILMHLNGEVSNNVVNAEVAVIDLVDSLSGGGGTLFNLNFWTVANGTKLHNNIVNNKIGSAKMVSPFFRDSNFGTTATAVPDSKGNVINFDIGTAVILGRGAVELEGRSSNRIVQEGWTFVFDGNIVCPENPVIWLDPISNPNLTSLNRFNQHIFIFRGRYETTNHPVILLNTFNPQPIHLDGLTLINDGTSPAILRGTESVGNFALHPITSKASATNSTLTIEGVLFVGILDQNSNFD